MELYTDKALRVLRFLRIIDVNNDLSITQLSVLFTLGYILTREHVQLQDLAVFVSSVIGYQIRRIGTGKPVNSADEAVSLQEALGKLETKVTALQMRDTLRPGSRNNS